MPIAGIDRELLMDKSEIRIGILEDDPDTRDYLKGLLDAEPDMDVVFDCGTLAGALTKVKETTPDICLVDIQLPDGSGIDLIKYVVENESGKCLILTVLGDRVSVLLAFETGANGYLLKDTPAEQIKRDIRAVITGGNPISPQAASHVLSLMQESTEPKEADKEAVVENILTAREQDVLLMFSRGLSYRETAQTLGLSVHTITDHVKSIYSKMSVHSRNEAVFEAVQNGWITL